MKILFELGHPAHVHVLKHTIWNLQKSGYETKIVARAREITPKLLKAYGFAYERLEKYNGLTNKTFGLFINNYKLFKIAKKFKPGIFVSVGSPHSAQVSTILRKAHISFGDTDVKKYTLYHLISSLTCPFSDVLCTPSCLISKINPKKHVKYEGYHELAYLHPNHFKPDPHTLDQLNLSDKDKFIIMRFAAWDAVHDIAHRGFKNNQERIEFVERLQTKCKIFVTSEVNIPELDKYKIPLAPEKIHHLLSFATMYIGEGATMASEAGVLGVPWIFVSSWGRGYLDDQEKNYGLGYTVSDSKEALRIALSLTENENLKNEWSEKRKKMLRDKIDVAKFMTEFIRRYPKSFHEYKNRKFKYS